MPAPLNVLIVEDSPDDAELIVAELRRTGFEPKWKRVETEPDFLAELKNRPDIIISDYAMPQFDGLRAADLLREQELDIPFILVSGTLGEEKAVEAMKRGVTDYLLKDRMARLGKAVQSAISQQRLRDDRKRLQQMLFLQSAAVATAANAIIITDRAGSIRWLNPAFTKLTGYNAEEVLGKTPRVLKSGLHGESFYHGLWQTILSGKTWHGEFTNRRKDGSLFYDEATITPVRSEDGAITHFIGVMQDITARKRAEEAVRTSDERFRQLAENINEVFWITGPAKNQMLYISPAYEKIWGRTCASLIESPRAWLEAIHPEDRPRVLEAAETKQARGEYDETYRIIRPDGSLRWIRDRAFPLRDANGEVYRVVGTAVDITDQRNLELQFRQAQKMESFGQLAAGVAHDFNNILTVIHCNASLLLMGESSEAELRDHSQQIVQAAERAASLTRQLLLFGRKQVMQPANLDLNEVAGDMTKMLKRIVGEDIALRTDFAPELPLTHADSAMIEQVLLNLVVNARDAMPGGGRLLIATSAKTVDEAEARQNPEITPGRCVCLSVSDSGCGIPSEILPRIFEPFFTTKDVGKGTGLGLATVYGIVKQHRGWIELSSEVGKGTTFRICLPAAEGRRVARTAAAGAPKHFHGDETILVVEDESTLRLLVVHMLQHSGYKVLQAESGVNALKVWKEHKREIDLLLTDLVMPDGMTGRELARRLQAEQPQLKVIYTSGYSADLASQGGIVGEGTSFLQKPYPPGKLVQSIRACLDQK